MPRIKHVYKGRHELSHVWVRNNMNRVRGKYSEEYPEPDGFRASNMFTDGRKIYSYGSHFCIAAFHPTRNDVVFATNRSYSNSTHKHQAAVHSAIPGNVTVIYCRRPEDATTADRFNIDDFRQRILSEVADSNNGTKRPHTRAAAILFAYRILDNYREYAKFAGVKNPMERLFADTPELPKFFRDRSAKQNAEKVLKAYEKRRKELEAGKAERVAVARAKREEKEQALRAEIAALGATPEAFAEYWRRTGKYPEPEVFGISWNDTEKRNALYSFRYNTNGELLRVVGNTVWTSRSASVPLEAAKLLYAAYISGRPIRGAEIGGFRVLEANQDGVRIGCHYINRSEIEHFGKMIAAK